MISRRLIRIKAFKTLYAYEASACTDIPAAQKNLVMSCEQVKKLYYFLLNITSSLIDVAQEKIDTGLQKFHPTEEESNPNLKFVNNGFAKMLADDPEFGRFCQKNGLCWHEYDVFINKIFNSIITKDYYVNYMNSGNSSFEEDCDLFSYIFQDEFEGDQDLEAILEEMSLFWIDDAAYTLNVIISNIETTKKKKKIIHPSTFLKEDDREFGKRLLEDAIIRYDEFIELISSKLSNWKTDRLVPTDASLIVLGLAEAEAFPTIPLKVTINEYVEIAKYYSTPNSRIFVNGILDKILQEKVGSGEIVKQGRGLIETN